MYRDDILFSEGDHAEDIFFVIEGSVKLYFDCSDIIPNELVDIDL